MLGKVSGGWKVWLQLEEELEVLFGICDMFFFFFLESGKFCDEFCCVG